MAVPLASGIAYALTAARSIQGGDSGELAAVGAVGGVAHPPGYPLYILWSRAFAWLPAGSPTHRVALTTAISAALAIFLLETAARAWGARPVAASLAAALFAVSPLAWRLATAPEVFMLNVAIASALVMVAAPAPWLHEERRAITLALLAGLGLANHHSIVLLAPLGLLAWASAVRRTERRALAVGGSLAALAIGLLPYGYLALAADRECVWGDTSTLHGLVHQFLRVDYGTTQLAASTEEPQRLAQLVLLGRTFLASGIVITLLVGAIVAVVRRRWSWPVAALTASLLLAGPIFVTRFNLPPHGLMSLVVMRFHLLPLALATVLGALGLDGVVDRVETPLAKRLALGGCVAALLARAAMSGADVVAEHRPTTERYLRNVLAMLPKDSILLAHGDDAAGGFEYLQCATGERSDVVVIAPPLMLTEWYGRRINGKLGFAVHHGERSPGEELPVMDATKLTEQLVASGRPVFLTKWFTPTQERLFPSYPLGPLIRLVQRPADIPSPRDLFEQNDAVYARLVLDSPPPVAHTWAGVRYLDYARPWLVLARAFEAQGQKREAQVCQDRANQFLPQDAPWD